MEQRIGILGGTFNPIHNAHLKMALDFSETLHFDKVLIIPTRIPPHKRAADMASTEDRLEMCRLAARSSPVFQVSDLEIRRPGPSYTSDTLEFLSGENPEARFYFLTGADMFLTIQDWRRPEKIFELATICAAPREKSDIFILQNHANRLKLQYGSLFQYFGYPLNAGFLYGNPQTDPLWGADRSFCAQAGGGLYPGTPPVSIKMGEVFPCPYQR